MKKLILGIIIIILIFYFLNFVYDYYLNYSYSIYKVNDDRSKKFFYGKSRFYIEKLKVIINNNSEHILIKWNKDKYVKDYEINYFDQLNLNKTNIVYNNKLEYNSKGFKEIKLTDNISCQFVQMFFIKDFGKNDIQILSKNKFKKVIGENNKIVFEGETNKLGLSLFSRIGYVLNFNKNYYVTLIFHHINNQLYTFIILNKNKFVRKNNDNYYINILENE